jgi:flavin reductase (DIM6/NTAB) family NADH-FMN oxidoreductase RutF
VEGFSSRDFRNAVGAFATGVTVVTTRGEEHAYGMTANAFSSVSLDPPLVLVCVITQSEGRDQIAANGVFAVNVLASDQEPISGYFASRDRPRGRDAFRDVPHHIGASGSPLLDGAACCLDCRLHAEHDAGDHRIFIGEVLEIEHHADREPLLFHSGRYALLTAVPAV